MYNNLVSREQGLYNMSGVSLRISKLVAHKINNLIGLYYETNNISWEQIKSSITKLQIKHTNKSF